MINKFDSNVNYRRSYIAHCQSGYYCYDRKVYVAERLRDMPSAQAGIIYTENGVQLVSYETIVAEIIDNWLHVYGTFSRTTAKHIGAFLKQFSGLHYSDAKNCINNGVEMNVNTKDERPAAMGMIQTIGVRV